jgi:hypothetical protein
MEVMISDLPHVMYHPTNEATDTEEQIRVDIARDQREKIKKGGLAAVAGLNLNFDKVIDGNALLAKAKRK